MSEIHERLEKEADFRFDSPDSVMRLDGQGLDFIEITPPQTEDGDVHIRWKYLPGRTLLPATNVQIVGRNRSP